MQWHAGLLRAARQPLACMPTLLPVQAQSAALLMSRTPHPGIRSAAGDWLRVLIGTNLISSCLLTLLVPLPLPLAAATHAALLLLTSNTAGICRSEVGAGGARELPRVPHWHTGHMAVQQSACVCVPLAIVHPRTFPMHPPSLARPPARLPACS